MRQCIWFGPRLVSGLACRRNEVPALVRIEKRLFPRTVSLHEYILLVWLGRLVLRDFVVLFYCGFAFLLNCCISSAARWGRGRS